MNIPSTPFIRNDYWPDYNDINQLNQRIDDAENEISLVNIRLSTDIENVSNNLNTYAKEQADTSISNNIIVNNLNANYVEGKFANFDNTFTNNAYVENLTVNKPVFDITLNTPHLENTTSLGGNFYNANLFDAKLSGDVSGNLNNVSINDLLANNANISNLYVNISPAPVQSTAVLGYDREGRVIPVLATYDIGFPENADYLQTDQDGIAFRGVKATEIGEVENLITAYGVKNAIDALNTGIVDNFNLVNDNLNNVYQWQNSFESSVANNFNDVNNVLNAVGNTFNEVNTNIGNTFNEVNTNIENSVSTLNNHITNVESNFNTLVDTKQPKTLSAPIVVGGVSSTTVEGALDNLNNLVDTKLPMVTSLPANPSNEEAVLYIGTATGGLKTGGIYQYQVSEWVLISYAESFTFNSDDFSVDTATSAVKLNPERRVYNGTKAAWDLLSVEEKTQYGATAFTDDEGRVQSWEDLSSQITTSTTGVTLTDVKCYKKGNLVSLSFDITIASDTTLESATRLFENIPKPKNINSIHVVSDVSNNQLVWSLISSQDNGFLCPGYNNPCIGVGRTTGLIEYFSED